jgi:pimeloyl-ACP methyl ester carboxylesterase
MKSQNELGDHRIDARLPGESASAAQPASLHLDGLGVSLAWSERGEGVPVVCLHAAGQGSSDFRLLAEQSPAGCRLVLLDWPGHGASGDDSEPFTLDRCVSVLTGFFNVVGLRNAILLATEFGAAVALEFARRHPRRVSGLILCEPAGLVPSDSGKHSNEPRFHLLRLARKVLGMRPDRPGRPPAEAEDQRAAALHDGHSAQRAQAAQSLAPLQRELRAALEEATFPVLVVLAAEGRICPIDRFQPFYAGLLASLPFPAASLFQLAVVTGSRSPLWEDPERMANTLTGFATATLPLEEHRHFWTLSQEDWPARGMNQWECTHLECHAELALPVGMNPNKPAKQS